MRRIKRIIIAVLAITALALSLVMVLVEIVLRSALCVLSPLWYIVSGDWYNPWEGGPLAFWPLLLVERIKGHWKV